MQETTNKHSDHRHLWLEGGAPSPGKLARARIRSAADIEALDQYQPTDLLPCRTLYECICHSAAASPDKPAFLHLLAADSSTPPLSISYRQLQDKVERAANLFRTASAGEPCRVSIILPMLPEALISAWAAATAGVGNPINPFLEVGQVAAIMNAAQSTVLVTTTSQYGPGVWDRLDELRALVPSIKRVLLVGGDNADDNFDAALAAQPSGLSFTPSSDPLADAIYLPTGGTTAAPKLVRMTHQGQLINAWITGAMAGASPEGVVGHAMPNFHVGGAVMLSLRAILYGQTVLTLTTDGFRNPGVIQHFWDIARHYRMTSLIATPATAAAILAREDADATGHCIETFNAGGSTVPIELLKNFHARFGIWIREVWGMTEVHGAVSGHPDDGRQPAAGSVGLRLPWHPVRAVVVDSSNHFVRFCEPGERGMLSISGPGVTPGYVDSKLNDEFFIKGMPDGKAWTATGDLGTVDESGHIWLFGRAKDVIVRGGHNLDPKMIEEVLVCHQAVLAAAAIGRPDPAKGEMPIAYVQLKEGHPCCEDELLALCRERVQERAAVPVEVIVIPTMPMTAVGKINKPALRVDAMQRVAYKLTRELAGEGTEITVRVDEKGKRPKVCVELTLPTPQQDLETTLKVAFSNYEFESEFTLQSR